MGRVGRYKSHVEPHLASIKTWSRFENERDIAKRLGVAYITFQKYKREHPELVQALKEGKQDLVADLKDALRKKALGFHYKETKTIQRKDGGKTTVSIETYEKYSPPDTVAAHLLLKNYDENWHNDDCETIKQKQKALEQTDRKIEAAEW